MSSRAMVGGFGCYAVGIFLCLYGVQLGIVPLVGGAIILSLAPEKGKSDE